MSIPDPTPVKAVLFDLGGVWIRLRDWPAAARHLGDARPLRAAFDDAYIGREAHAFESGRLGAAGFFASLAAELGTDADHARALWLARLEAPFPGTGALLDELEGAGLALGCLSNTNPVHWEALCACLPIRRLRHPLVSHELGVMKPAAGIYVAAERALGLSPAAIAFFDDRAENVEAARARGWRAALVDPAHAEPPARQMRAALLGWGVALPR